MARSAQQEVMRTRLVALVKVKEPLKQRMVSFIVPSRLYAVAETDYILLVSKPNGATKPDSTATLKKDSATANHNRDVEMKDSPDAEEATANPGTTQTPASTKKASNGSSKKKAAVPEHKTKKLNKKQSKRLTNLDAEPGQYYLARMKGHPPWPSVICDEEMLPMSLLDTRPVTTKLPDGTYKKPEYADGGKRVHDRTFPIMFL